MNNPGEGGVRITLQPLWNRSKVPANIYTGFALESPER
jgi:hypothetical protein